MSSVPPSGELQPDSGSTFGDGEDYRDTADFEKEVWLLSVKLLLYLCYGSSVKI